MTNICGSILFTLLLENQAWIYAPAIGGLIMVVLGFVGLKEAPAMKITDRTFRLASGVLAILAMLCLLLPSHVVSVPESITADPADAAAMNRSTPLWKEMLGNEPNLRAEAAEKGVYGSVLTGDIEVLVPYSNDANNIQGIFTIGSSTAAPNAYLIAAMILLALTALLAFLAQGGPLVPAQPERAGTDLRGRYGDGPYEPCAAETCSPPPPVSCVSWVWAA